jgi:hypothetical protein
VLLQAFLLLQTFLLLQAFPQLQAFLLSQAFLLLQAPFSGMVLPVVGVPAVAGIHVLASALAVALVRMLSAYILFLFNGFVSMQCSVSNFSYFS